MAFDFPASPAVGDVYAPSGGACYSWDGEKWGGGGYSQMPDEQLFDMGGKTAQDIVVPTWAKSCEIEGYGPPNGTNMFVMRYSADGVTFPSGAGDYGYFGPYHNTGSNGYAAQTSTSGSAMYLTFQGDNVALGHFFKANISLTRQSTSHVLGNMQVRSHAADSSSGALFRTFWLSGYASISALGSALRIGALRILYANGSAMAAGSWVRVKWHGDRAQLPVQNGIPDAPSDGNEYVRVNGVWRLKSKTIQVTTNFADFAVPTGAKMGRFSGMLWQPSSNNVYMRWSIDGTNFFSGAGDYTMGGYVHAPGTAANGGMIPLALTSLTSIPLSNNNTDNAQIPMLFDADVVVTKGAGTPGWGAKTRATCYVSTSTLQMIQTFLEAYSNNAPMQAASQLKAIRFGATNISWTAGSQISVDWIY